MKINHLKNIIVVSDLHCGCQFGLCTSKKFQLDGGGYYEPSDLQKKVYRWWRMFWNQWVPQVTKGEKYILVINGDILDGRHHQNTTQISHNLSDQENLAYEILAPVTEKAEKLYIIRGTEAHAGKSAENEERLAEKLKSEKNLQGNHAWFELWIKLNRARCHFTHHIGTTGRTHYETSAVMAELAELYAEAGRWKKNPPDVVCRSHRHRSIEVRVPSALGYGISFVTAGWQLKTPYTYRIPGGRISTPQFGGSLIRSGDEDDVYTRHFVRNVEQSDTVKV